MNHKCYKRLRSKLSLLDSECERMSIRGDNSVTPASQVTCSGIPGNLGPLTPRQVLVFEARVAEQACRFDEMAKCMRKVLEMVSENITPEEMELLSSAYKNKIRARRASWKIISGQVQKEIVSGRLRWAFLNQKYLEKIETEIHDICNEILIILEENLRPSITSPGLVKVFFYKMKGDYHRYLAEFSTGNVKLSMVDNCQSAYNAALSLAYSELTPIHPLRLSLLLNVGVFYHEIRGDPKNATRLACSGFRDAVPMFPALKDQSPQTRESWSALVLLKDYYVRWNADLKDQDSNGYEDSSTVEDDIIEA